jgi:uncharacterized repeat protein (TIGR02543 family)
MWAASDITVKLYVHGGTISADGWSSKSSGTYFQKKVAKSTPFDIPAPTQEGYSFVNWTVNEDGTGDSYTTSHSGSGSNITLHAQWLELPYTPTHLIDNKLKVNAEWNSKLYTTDATNITGLVDWQVAPGKDRTSNVTDKQTGKSDRTPAIFTTSTKEDDNYMYLSFTIASGKRLKLSAVNIPVFGISNSKTTLVEIEDAYSTKISVNGTITKDADGNGFGSYDFANVPYLKGTVTVKMWAYGSADGYRMKTPVYLDGTISDAPTEYAVSFDKNNEGASGTMSALYYEAGAVVTLPACGFTAPTGMEFDAWTSTDVTISDNKFTMPNKPVTIKATWKALVAKYTVIFKDGDTELGTKLFDVSTNPSDADIDKTKPLYTFAAWQKDEADIALDAAFWATVVKDAEITLTARWTKAYAQSIDMEQFVIDNKKSGNWKDYLDAANIAYSADGLSLDSLDSSKGNNNYPYLGLKFNKNKTADLYVTGNLKAGKLMIVKVGNISSTHMDIDGVTQTTPAIVGGTDTEPACTYWYYNADKEFKLVKTNSSTASVLKAIVITDPYQVTFDANGGDPVAPQNGTPSVTLPLPVKGTESFLGWFDGDTKVGEAGESYTPTANITLKAHWEAISTDARLASITFSSNAGTLSPAFDPEVTAYTYTMPYKTAAIPTITGATSVSDKAKAPVIDAQAANWGDVAHIHGVAQSDDTKDYYITMKIEPKDGVCLVWADATGNSAMTVDAGKSLFAATAAAANTKNTATYGGKTGYKFNSRPANMSVTLSEETFQENDVVEVFVTQLEGADKLRVFTSNDDAAMLKEEGNALQLGVNKLTLPTTSTASLYLRRSAEGGTYENWNPFVAYIAVYRAMMPKLTEMTIDGRTVTINEAAKTATVTIPYEADLAALTITKTIVWNAPATENSIVVNDGSAWTLGENTYKLTDKDGDATTYTITVARDVLKHTVSFNTHGGSAVANEEVEHNAYLAAAPTAPTKEDYIFQYWSLSDGGAEVDVTTVQIDEDKTFHAVWASDGALKLINKTSGVVNEDGYFITGVTATEANSEKAAAWGGTQGATISGTNQLGKIVQYNATTNQTKLQIKVYNTNGSDKYVYIHKVIEGKTTEEAVETLTATSNAVVTSEYYEFNDTKNRSFYITTNSTDVKILQVKVIESGETPMKQAGEAGYSLNLNKGRALYYANSDVTFEGLALQSASNYNVISSTEFQTTKNFSFSISTPVLLKVTTNTAKYYVSQDPDEDGTTATAVTDAGTAEFNLTTTGTWYLVPSTTSNVKYTNIAFELPKAAKPVVADLDNVDYCSGDVIDELAVSATVSDGGTKLYQWYKDGVKIDGAEAATYQPTADGEYYVVVVNTKADHQNSDPTQSNTITVTGHAGTAISGTTGAEDWPDADVTISVTASGKNMSYAWYTCDDAMGTNPVAVDPAVNAAELDVTVGAADTYYKVVVSGDCGDAQEAIITVVARQAVELQDVTGNMSWDFSKANDGSAATSNLCTDEVMANVHGINNNDDFKSAYLKATANKFSGSKLQASMIKFHTTVDGMITVVFSNTDNKSSERYLTVNGRKTDKGSKTKTAVTYTGFVYAGDVELGVVEGDGNMLNFTSVAFKATVDYPRTVNPSNIGTLCWTNNAILGGGTLYEFAGKDEYSKLVFDEVAENRLEAGKPYIFMPENGNTEIKLYNTDDEAALTEDQAPVNHMYGTIVGKTLVPGVDDNMYYFSSNHIWAIKDFVVNIDVPAYRCYIDYPAVLADAPAPAPAPGRRRVTMGVNGQNTATGMENLNSSDKPVKLLINGQIFILRGEKLFDATGRLVK